VIERGQHLRFALEAGQSFRISGERGGQDLQRDVAIESRIARAIDLAHSAFAQFGQNLIGSYRPADHNAADSIRLLSGIAERARFVQISSALHRNGNGSRT
jgi:hypothetical protein